LASLREEILKREEKAVSLDAFRKLVDDVQEVDQKRIADNKLVREELAKILKAVAEAASAPAGGRAKPPLELKSQQTEGDPKNDTKPQKFYEYVVQKDDTVSAIAAAYRAQGIKVSVEDILKANPGLKPEQMRIGQKLTIPAPAN
jgi:LysM repeat protein